MNDVNEFFPFLFIILGFIVLILAIYLGFLFNEIKKQSNKRKKINDDLDARKRKNDEHVYESLRIISLAVSQSQCEISEGCVRIHKLMGMLDDFEKRQTYELFDELYEKLKDFDYLDARNKLDKQEKFNQDKLRFAIEDEYRDRMIVVCKELSEHMRFLAP